MSIMKINTVTKQEIKLFLKKKLEDEKNKVFVYSPYSLSKEEINQVFEIIPFLKVRPVENIIDRQILAGIKVQYGSKILDLSLNAWLKNLASRLHENN